MVRASASIPLLFAVGTGACLSTPSPAVDAMGAPAECGTGVAPTAAPWPPTGVVVRSMLVTDVDVDGRDDLVIAVAPPVSGGPEPSQIHVLYGPLPVAAPYLADVVIEVGATAEIGVRGVRVEDLDDDGCPELVAAGTPAQSGGSSYLAIWPHDGSLDPWTATPARQLLRFDPINDDLHMTWAQLSDQPRRDLLIATTSGNVDLFVGPTGVDIDPSLAVPPPSCGWDYINHQQAVADDGDRERVVSFGLRRWNAITMDELGVPVVTENCPALAAPLTLSGVAVDLDGNPPLDALVGGGGPIGAYLLAGAADPEPIANGAMGCTARGPEPYTEGLAVGDLGGTSALDAIVIDWDNLAASATLGQSFVCLAESIDATTAGVTRSSVNERNVGVGRVQAVVIADLTAAAGNEAWVVDNDGRLRCFQRGSSPILEECEEP